MKTGKTLQNGEITNIQKNLIATFTVLSSMAIESAHKYAEHATRKHVTPEDMIIGLKYEYFHFSERDGIESEMRIAQTEIFDGSFESSSSESSSYESSESEVFLPSQCQCEFCNEVHRINQNWSSTTPENVLEELIYNAINSV